MTANAVEARPWAPSDGPRPRVTAYPPHARPGMWVRAGGEWRYGTVLARQDHPDGRVAYQIEVRTPDARDGVEGVRARLYQWPQDGLRPAGRDSGA